jgi:hypothetical protein
VALSTMATSASARHVHHGSHVLIDPALIVLAAAPLIWGPPGYAYVYGYACYLRRERTRPESGREFPGSRQWCR